MASSSSPAKAAGERESESTASAAGASFIARKGTSPPRARHRWPGAGTIPTFAAKEAPEHGEAHLDRVDQLRPGERAGEADDRRPPPGRALQPPPQEGRLAHQDEALLR